MPSNVNVPHHVRRVGVTRACRRKNRTRRDNPRCSPELCGRRHGQAHGMRQRLANRESWTANSGRRMPMPGAEFGFSHRVTSNKADSQRQIEFGGSRGHRGPEHEAPKVGPTPPLPLRHVGGGRPSGYPKGPNASRVPHAALAPALPASHRRKSSARCLTARPLSAAPAGPAPPHRPPLLHRGLLN